MKTNNFKESSRSSRSLDSRVKRGAENKRSLYSFLLGIFVVALFSGCSDSGSVGGGISDPGTNLIIDTVEIADVRTDTLILYSGNLNFFSAGKLQDPLFGNLSASGFFKPVLASNANTLAFDELTEVTMKLVVNNEGTYGTVNVEQVFELHVIQELWRGNEWKINDAVQLEATPLTSFSIGNNDTISISMPEKWVQKYGKYFNSDKVNRDSTYAREFYGLSMVPQNTAKIVTINPFATKFVATNLDVVPDSTYADSVRVDSLVIDMYNWAYRLERTGMSSQFPSSSKLLSTLERVIRFDFDFSYDNLGTRNIAKVELIFYRDNLLLKQSNEQAPPSFVRPVADTLKLHFVDGDELPQSISGGNYIASAGYRAEDEAYHFDITRYIRRELFENAPEELAFYLTVGGRGIIRSTLLYNNQASGKAPKVVITYVEPENN